MSIWQTLGIDATRDESTIRSAYRQQVRDCHPETEPEGFQLLRDAAAGLVTAAATRLAQR